MLTTITSQIVPIPRRDIDTDLIIPAEFLTVTVKTGLGKHLFDRVRKSEKDFELMETYDNAAILVTRENFGCGSSREHAAWALHDWGVRVVIAPSFADIFRSNAMKNGLLPVVLPEAVVEVMLRDAMKAKAYVVTVDLPKQTVTLPASAPHSGATAGPADGKSYSFDIDPYRKTCLMEGMDDMEYLLAHKKEIAVYDKQRAEHLFFDLKKI